MDISLFTCNDAKRPKPGRSTTASQACRPQTRRMGPMPRTGIACANSSPQCPVPVKRSHKRTPSNFRWRSSVDIVIGSLRDTSFTITGTLSELIDEDLVEMIETLGGTVYKTLAKKSQYLITGRNASQVMVKEAIDSAKTILNEKEFMALVKQRSKQFAEDLMDEYMTDNSSSDGSNDGMDDRREVIGEGVGKDISFGMRSKHN